MNANQRQIAAQEFAARYDRPPVAEPPVDAVSLDSIKSRLNRIEAMLDNPDNDFDFLTRQQMRDEMFDLKLDLGLFESQRNAGE